MLYGVFMFFALCAAYAFAMAPQPAPALVYASGGHDAYLAIKYNGLEGLAI